MIIHGGDMFDIPRVSPDFVGQLANIIRLSGVPWYVVPGNHDIYGHTVDTVSQTMLGLLSATDTVHLLTRKTPITFYDNNEHMSVSFQGQEYYADIDKGNPRDYEVDFDPSNAYHVLVAHSMLLDKPFGVGGVTHTLIQDLKTTADVIMVGHYHPGYPVQTIGKTMVVNPGSMARVNAGAGDDRIPQYSVFDFSNQGIKHKFVKFQCAKPAKDVLDYVGKHQSKIRQNNLTQFQSLLQTNIITPTALDIHAVLNEIAIDPNNQVDPQLVADSLLAMGKTQISKDDSVPKLDGFVETPQRIWISKIEGRNFQSWKALDVDLSPGLNVIKGESNSGKTAIMRLIRWVQTSEPKGADMISNWAKDVWGKITYSNGFSIERQRTKKDSGTVNIYDQNGTLVGAFKGVKDNPIDVSNVHQMPHIWFTKDEKRNIASADQLDTSFLVTESAGLRASAIGRLTGLQNVDATIRVLNADNKSLSKVISVKEDLITKDQVKLTQFADLPDLDNKIKELQVAIDFANDLEQETEDLKTTLASLTTLETQIDNVTSRILKLKKLPPQSMIDTAEKVLNELLLCRQLKIDYTSVEDSIKDVTTKITDARFIHLVNKPLHHAEDLLREINELTAINDELVQLNCRIQLNSKEDLAKRKAVLTQVEILTQEADKIVVDLYELKSLSAELIGNSNTIKANIALLNIDNAHLKEIDDTMNALFKAGACTCPTCGQIIASKDILIGGS